MAEYTIKEILQAPALDRHCNEEDAIAAIVWESTGRCHHFDTMNHPDEAKLMSFETKFRVIFEDDYFFQLVVAKFNNLPVAVVMLTGDHGCDEAWLIDAPYVNKYVVPYLILPKDHGKSVDIDNDTVNLDIYELGFDGWDNEN